MIFLCSNLFGAGITDFRRAPSGIVDRFFFYKEEIEEGIPSNLDKALASGELVCVAENLNGLIIPIRMAELKEVEIKEGQLSWVDNGDGLRLSFKLTDDPVPDMSATAVGFGGSALLSIPVDRPVDTFFDTMTELANQINKLGEIFASNSEEFLQTLGEQLGFTEPPIAPDYDFVQEIFGLIEEEVRDGREKFGHLDEVNTLSDWISAATVYLGRAADIQHADDMNTQFEYLVKAAGVIVSALSQYFHLGPKPRHFERGAK